MKLTPTEQFRHRLATEKEGISLISPYNGATGRLTLQCSSHGVWETTPARFLRKGAGRGCPKCTYERWGSERRKGGAPERKETAPIDVGHIQALKALGFGSRRVAREIPGLSSGLAAYYLRFKPSTCEEHGAEWSKDGTCLKCRQKERSTIANKAAALAFGDKDFLERFKRKSQSIALKLWEDDTYKARRAEGVFKNPQAIISSLNRTVFDALASLGVGYIAEKALGPYNFDAFLPAYNLLVECHGEYWHSLPRAARVDKGKATYVERYHSELRLLVIWEVEFHKQGRVMHILQQALGLNPEIPAISWDALRVEPIDRNPAARFLGIHHYLGSIRGGNHAGLYEGPELIGVCSFGPFQRNEQTAKYGKDALELTRFCLAPAKQVKNLSSWFLSRCLKRVACPVVTYADTTQGHTGALYKACNFDFSHEVPPDYFYVDNLGWVLHKRTVWGRASKMRVSEVAYANRHGLAKKWGGAKKCFIYQPR